MRRKISPSTSSEENPRFLVVTGGMKLTTLPPFPWNWIVAEKHRPLVTLQATSDHSPVPWKLFSCPSEPTNKPDSFEKPPRAQSKPVRIVHSQEVYKGRLHIPAETSLAARDRCTPSAAMFLNEKKKRELCETD
ncbi:hypothetical protein NDU88_002231 [Pleurodeles waltl]|uniref:Uncharacterized protein n=1 Tax=Pleurodeles waltl TaxID=8319 RepID=A0AAV7WQ26_PLEWA|nr:hypothetical protein NDU88_002231 [Pleurodeles waltl]